LLKETLRWTRVSNENTSVNLRVIVTPSLTSFEVIGITFPLFVLSEEFPKNDKNICRFTWLSSRITMKIDRLILLSKSILLDLFWKKQGRK
jgi:hypothetical protein